MKYYSEKSEKNGCFVEVSAFETGMRAAEYNLMLHVDGNGGFEEQLDSLHETLKDVLGRAPFNDIKVIFKRYFIGDISLHNDLLSKKLQEFPPCAVSVIQQPPLDGTLIALWLYARTESCSIYNHIWTVGKQQSSGSIGEQTIALLADYEDELLKAGGSIKENCLRTWFFVEDIDNNYKEFAESRKEYFTKTGLTEKTHYIASTGIEGNNAVKGSKITMDAYAIEGIKQDQVKYLYAISHLSPTYDYGVTFERGVYLQYGDRRQIYISGTASIDNQGDILHVGNIKGQILRIWENVKALLNEADASFEDIAGIIVYLRNSDDYNLVKNMFDEHFPRVPAVITFAHVCRPEWLIEMECTAITDKGDYRFETL